MFEHVGLPMYKSSLVSELGLQLIFAVGGLVLRGIVPSVIGPYVGICLLSSFCLFRTRWVRYFMGDKVDDFHSFFFCLMSFRSSPMALHLNLHLRFFIIHDVDADAENKPSGPW